MYNSSQYGRIFGGDASSSTYIPVPIVELTFWGQASVPLTASWSQLPQIELTPWYVGPIPAPAPVPPGITYRFLLEDGSGAILLQDGVSYLELEH
jgi:hypothetical protein